jgi:RimJ/RimL family protein N-acetyltransferase
MHTGTTRGELMAAQLLEEVILRGGARVSIRPVLPDDVELEREFILRLSPESRRLRFLHALSLPTEELLKRLTHLNTASEAAFVALTFEGSTPRAVGVARMTSVGEGRAEYAVSVLDDWRNLGLGTELTRRVVAAARCRGIRELFGVVSSDNHAMQQFAAFLGFAHRMDPEDARLGIHTLELDPHATHPFNSYALIHAA